MASGAGCETIDLSTSFIKFSTERSLHHQEKRATKSKRKSKIKNQSLQATTIKMTMKSLPKTLLLIIGLISHKIAAIQSPSLMTSSYPLDNEEIENKNIRIPSSFLQHGSENSPLSYSFSSLDRNIFSSNSPKASKTKTDYYQLIQKQNNNSNRRSEYMRARKSKNYRRKKYRNRLSNGQTSHFRRRNNNKANNFNFNPNSQVYNPKLYRSKSKTPVYKPKYLRTAVPNQNFDNKRRRLRKGKRRNGSRKNSFSFTNNNNEQSKSINPPTQYSKLNSKLHYLTQSYANEMSRINGPISPKSKNTMSNYNWPDYDDNGINTHNRKAQVESLMEGIPLSEIERNFGIREKRVVNTLRRYKSLLTMLLRQDPYKTFYQEISNDCKYFFNYFGLGS